MLEKRTKRTGLHAVIFVFLQLLAVHSFSSARAFGAARPQEQQKPALGSLTTVGEVYVNGAAAPSESTIFAGDVLRSTGTGSATFTSNGKASLQIYPNTEIVFTGEPQYAAELKLGRVMMSSLNGTMGMNVRTGSSVVAAVAEGEPSTSDIEAPSDGSFVVTCVGGSVGVIPLQGGKGIFIEAGQSVGVAAQGELSALSPQALHSAAPISTAPAPDLQHKRGYKRWILIGLGTVGVGAASAVLSTRHSGTPSNSPAASAAASSSSPSSTSPSSSTSSSNPPSSTTSSTGSNPTPPPNNPPGNPLPPLPLPVPLASKNLASRLPALPRPQLPQLTIHLAFHF